MRLVIDESTKCRTWNAKTCRARALAKADARRLLLQVASSSRTLYGVFFILGSLNRDPKRLMKRIGSLVYSLVAAAGFVWMAQEGQCQPAATPTPQPVLASPFESEVSTLESRISSTQTSTNPIIFYGSSSFRLWKSMQQDFPGYPILNCGFGGSRLTDCVRYANRLVIPRKPSAIVIYAGDNDLALGTPPEQVFQSFQRLFEIFRAYSPSVPIAFVSVKPSPARLKYLPNIIKFN